MDDYERAMNVLQANAAKTFVKRILDPDKYPTLDLGDGNIATHKMSWGEAGGKYFVYPTVLLTDGNKLRDYGDSAWDHVRATQNYIEFDSADDADWFSRNYKAAWGGKRGNAP